MSDGARMHEFDAEIRSAGEGGGAYVIVPFDVEAVFGRKRVPVQATIDGEAYRGTLVRMGGRPEHLLGVLKEIRRKIRKDVGDVVHVTIREDTAPREVAVPPDLATALRNDAAAGAFFDSLSYTHRKDYVEWIEEAKRAETREARVAKAVALLAEGVKSR